MGLPWQAISVASLVAGVFFTLQQPVYSRGFFLGAFASTWLALLLAWALYEVFLWPKLLSPLRSLPQPKGNHWLLGQWPRIAADPSGIPQLDWVTNIRNDGLIRYLGFFNQERLLVTSPKALAEVLVTKNYDFQKPSSIKWSIGRVLGIGVLLAEGDDHKMQRKNLMPAFAFRHVKDLYPVFWSKAREGVQAMTNHVLAEAAAAAKGSQSSGAVESGEKSAAIEANGWGSRITLDIIGVAGLGRDFGAVKDPTNPLTQTYGRIFKPSRQAQILALLGLLLPGPLVNALPLRRNGDIAAASAVIRATCRDLIHEKKDRLARGEPADADILSVALESGGFSDENLVDQMMTFLAAGHETTASAMTWAVYLLCLHPEVQSRLRAEVRERLPSPSAGAGAGAATSAEGKSGASRMDDKADITALDVDRMPYLSAVCSEVLRYFSPVPLTLRQAVVDTTIAGQHVPKGTRIILCPWATNKDPALWGPDAKEFKPDRWLATGSTAAAGMGGEGEDGKVDSRATASGGASSNYAFMTFLHGPRSCIGQGFAKAEFACILATWIGRFEFRLKNEEEYDESKVEIRGGVTARPAKGMHVHARVVDGW